MVIFMDAVVFFQRTPTVHVGRTVGLPIILVGQSPIPEYTAVAQAAGKTTTATAAVERHRCGGRWSKQCTLRQQGHPGAPQNLVVRRSLAMLLMTKLLEVFRQNHAARARTCYFVRQSE